MAQKAGMTPLDSIRLRTILDLDSWASIASFAIPLLKEYGPQAVRALYHKFVP